MGRIIIGGFFLALVGCQLSPVKYDREQEGQWQAKALVRDKQASKSAIIHLDINAVRGQKIRLDATAALGHPVASLVMNGEQLTYVLFEPKEFYRGAPNAAALKPILGVALDPRILYNLMFDLPITDKGWQCAQDKKGYLAECRKADGDYVVRWSERQGRRKLISLEHPKAMVQISVTEFQPKVQEREGLFELNPPKTFKAIR